MYNIDLYAVCHNALVAYAMTQEAMHNYWN